MFCLNQEIIQIVLIIFLSLYIYKPVYSIVFLITCIIINIYLSTSRKYTIKKKEKYNEHKNVLDSKNERPMVTPIVDVPSEQGMVTPIVDVQSEQGMVTPIVDVQSEMPVIQQQMLPMSTINPNGDITSLLKHTDANAFINTDILSRNSHTPFKHITQLKEGVDIRQNAFEAYQGHVQNQAEMFKEGVDRYVKNRNDNFNDYMYNSY